MNLCGHSWNLSAERIAKLSQLPIQLFGLKDARESQEKILILIID